MSVTNAFTWPIYFPENVPPIDTVVATGVAFRLVDNFPPTADDFMSYFEIDSMRKYDTEELRVKSYGVSLWVSESKIKRGIKNYPNDQQFATKKIVKGELTASMGVIPSKLSKRGHITLWKYENAFPHVNFIEQVK